ncbi:MAG: double-strand break repair helicase AddA [Rubellimicrobium sp.]|nr:double-strand break repair helicase AddA [Rubellimicrobium sp.]
MIRDDATEAQARAADPGVSTWLTANAGSGKTRVLTDRVARLLLAGTSPQNILCLTYTKAAAAEMQNRLFLRLGEWAMLDDDALRAALRDLGEDVAPGGLAAARRLFAQAMEVPGGLRIQTIHAFCASLLRRFPLEAGVSPDFTEMDDRTGALLRDRVAEALALDDPALTDAFLAHASGDDIDPMLRAITAARGAFADAFDDAALRDTLEIPPDLTLEQLVDDLLGPRMQALLADLVPLLLAGSTMDQRAGQALRQVQARADDLAVLESVFLYGATAKVPFGAKIGAFPTKATREKAPGVIVELEHFMAWVEGARDWRRGLLALERARALHDYAHAFLARLDAEKLRRGMVDFDDLIARAQALLSNPAVAQWVLWKLDGGIDHILVDEAQDTSPRQWAVIRGLAQEFAAGQGARDVTRTIFVVGDRKQSIYSFQGADPDEFDRMRGHFEDELGSAGAGLRDGQLAWSFRSAPAVLRAVDAVFHGEAQTGLGESAQHFAFWDAMPGRVDLWPPVPKEQPEEAPEDWTAPVDRVSPRDPAQVLARRVAAEVARMVRGGVVATQKDGLRRIGPGDILILVQRRSDLFHALIRELKAHDVPVAGADRLRVGAELAVRDIGALLRFLALADDDLSLAEALRSPLLGWSEAELYALAQPRKGTLWQALRASGRADTLAVLDDLRRQADFLRPYDLINRLLVRHDGRRRLLGRLGVEAEDGIDALLSQALAYESVEVPSLTGFVEWMRTDASDFKRQIDAQGGALRVMTVHGAKGLESPVVILPDCAVRRPGRGAAILPVAGGALWAAPAADATAVQRALQEEARARDEAERRRLLYVAMTRAESWLIVAAAGETGAGGESWHAMVEAGLGHAGAVTAPMPGGAGLRLESGDWGQAARVGEAAARATPVQVDPAPVVQPPRPAVVSPSDLGGAVILPGEVDSSRTGASLARGRLMHRLLEHLPEAPEGDRPALAQAMVGRDPDAVAAGADAVFVAQALAMAALFAPGALVEAGITGTLPDGRRISGQVDRLEIGAGAVVVTDYKSNRTVPARPEDVPEGILRQMGAYVHALAAIWPGRRIEARILWTATGLLMPLPHAGIMAALQRACAP